MGSVKVKDKIRGLDELRGIAAVLVVIYHLYQSYFRGIPNYSDEGFLTYPVTFDSSFNLLNELSCGVNLFFVLSGFLIHLLYKRKVFDSPTAVLFIKKRFVRIIPPYYASLLIALAGGLLIQYFKADLWNILTHLLFIHNISYDYAFGIQAVYWSIAVEVQFYLLYCLFRYCTDRFAIKNIFLWFFIIWLLISVVYKYWLYQQVDGHTMTNAGLRWMILYNTILRFPEWLLGALFYEYLSLIKNIRFKTIWITVLLAITMYLNHWFAWHVFGSDLVYSLAFSLLIVCLTDLKKDIAVLVFLGNMSYTLYLNHFLIYSVWDTLWLKVLNLPKVASFERFWIMFSGFFVCLLVSYILYRLIEKPAMNLKALWVDHKTSTPTS